MYLMSLQSEHRPWGPCMGTGPGAVFTDASLVGHFSMTARTSRADRTRYSSPAHLTSVPPYFE